MTDFAQSAQSYAENGWLVFPLKPKSKEPITEHGFKDASCDVGVIRRWWRTHPQANIGVVTGRVSNLVVVDFDPRKGGDVHAFMREYGDHFSGLRIGKVATGGAGQHWWFAYPDADFKSRKDVVQGIDVKSDGGYVVAPPSIHPDGGRYVWLE